MVLMMMMIVNEAGGNDGISKGTDSAKKIRRKTRRRKRQKTFLEKKIFFGLWKYFFSVDKIRLTYPINNDDDGYQ